MQKRQILRNGPAPIKNDITDSESAFGIANILQKHAIGIRYITYPEMENFCDT